MTEVVTQTGSAADTSAPAPASAPTPTVPEGYVPLADLEREQARARGFQSELGKATSRLAELEKPAPVTTQADGSPDVSALIERGMSDAVARVFRAGELRDTAATLREQFPKVAEFDPGVFSADRLAQYADGDALRAYVEDVNSRLTKLLQPGQADADAAARDALAAAAAGSNGPTGTGDGATGGLTVEAISQMNVWELDEYEKEHPGVIDKVMAGVSVT